MTNETSQPIFEIPDTAKSRAFMARHPQFPDALLKLFDTANKCFGRNPRPKNHLEHICFWLGHTCRQEFLEIVFLAINGYGAGATKILRSLYERAVTIEYLVQNPHKVDRFLQFAAIQENRPSRPHSNKFRRIRSTPKWAAKHRGRTRKCYEQYKGNFEATARSTRS